MTQQWKYLEMSINIATHIVYIVYMYIFIVNTWRKRETRVSKGHHDLNLFSRQEKINEVRGKTPKKKRV